MKCPHYDPNKGRIKAWITPDGYIVYECKDCGECLDNDMVELLVHKQPYGGALLDNFKEKADEIRNQKEKHE